MITLNKNGLFNRFISVYGLRGEDCYSDTLCSLFMRSILGVLVVLHIIILPTLIVLANMHVYYSFVHDVTGRVVYLNDLSLIVQCIYALYLSVILLVQATIIGGFVLSALYVVVVFSVVYISATIEMTITNLVGHKVKQLKTKLCIKVNWKDK